jgi:hypothetical protein
MISTSISASAFVFTFVSALFLPCTFVASVFSMSMFNWQPDPAAGSNYVSDKFWVYWAVSFPLTVFVMTGWYVWSKHGMNWWRRSNLSSKTAGVQVNARKQFWSTTARQE